MIHTINMIKEYIALIGEWLTYIYYLLKTYMLNYLSIITIVIFVSIKKATNSILLNSITADGIFFAIDFMADSFVNSIEKNKEDGSIFDKIDKINKSYTVPFFDNLRLKPKSGIFDRYIYYLLLAIFYNVLDLMFWGKITWWIYSVLIITIHPYIIDYVLIDTKIGTVMNKIYWSLNMIYKDILFSFLAYGINNICMAVLQKDPKIKSGEISNFINEKDQSYVNIINFIKIFLVTSLIHYLKYIGFYYAKVIQLLYSYGALVEIKNEYVLADPLEHIIDPKEKILHIIESRNLELLLNQNILGILIKIYTDNDENKSVLDKFKEKIKYIEIVASKFCAFYSISALMGNSIYSITASLIILYIQNHDMKYYIPRIFGVIVWFYGGNILYISMLCELFELLYNRASNYIIDKMTRIIRENYHYVIHKNDYNIDILANTSLLVYYKANPLLPALWIINKNKIIYGTLMFCGFFSEYDGVHMFVIDLVLYICVNLYHEIDKKIIEIKVIDNYYDKSDKYNMKPMMKRQRSMSLIDLPVHHPIEIKNIIQPSVIEEKEVGKLQTTIIIDDYFIESSNRK